MVWSFSSSRMFRKCQRQWYFKSIIAEARSKDPVRHEAYLLSKLQTVFSWRGSLVDRVILMRYVSTLKRGQRAVLADLLKYAKDIFGRQLEFGLGHRLRDPGMKVTHVGDAFAAFFDIEYGEGISQSQIDAAWEDVERALTTLAHMSALQDQLLSATHLIPQRSLSFMYDEIKARGQPDLVAFFADQPPLIIDWKVHTYAVQDYRLQLALYAIALSNCKPHRDFPRHLFPYEAADVQLIEVQLLTNQLRTYQLTAADINAAANHMSRSMLDMELALDSMDREFSISELPVTLNPDECLRCPFRSMCWSRG